jgi:hypothetical protein
MTDRMVIEGTVTPAATSAVGNQTVGRSAIRGARPRRAPYVASSRSKAGM